MFFFLGKYQLQGDADAIPYFPMTPHALFFGWYVGWLVLKGWKLHFYAPIGEIDLFNPWFCKHEFFAPTFKKNIYKFSRLVFKKMVCLEKIFS